MPSFVNEFVRRVSRNSSFPAQSDNWNSDPERNHCIARPCGALRPSLLLEDMSGSLQSDVSFDPTGRSRNRGDTGMACIIVGMMHDGFLPHTELLVENMLDVAAVSDIAAATALRFAHKGRLAHMLLVDIDAQAHYRPIVEDLIAFRRYSGGTAPVVIGSRSFKDNDFSMERAAIADASIRLPASTSDMEVALSVAVVNNGRLAA
jgi:hypothetical protein